MTTFCPTRAHLSSFDFWLDFWMGWDSSAGLLRLILDWRRGVAHTEGVAHGAGVALAEGVTTHREDTRAGLPAR